MERAAAVSEEIELSYSDVEESLRDTVQALLRKRCSPEILGRIFDGDRTGTTELWRTLAVDLGLAGLLVPEQFGGAGATAREAAVTLEELGRFVAPVPFLTSAVVGTTVLRLADATDLLGSAACGDVTVCLAVPVSTGPGGLVETVTAAGNVLHGIVRNVAGALEADLLLIPVAGQDGLELYALHADSARVTPVVSLDMTRQLADIDVTGVTARLLISGGAAEAAVHRALVAAAGLMASEQLGLARQCLQITVDYLGVRRQFGRIVGSFQALKHRLSDLYIEVESACAAARYAAATLADDHADQETAAAVAKAYCSDVAVHAAEECVQLHGGIGMTWEHPAHLYLKRAKADQIAFGAPGAHRALLAVLVDLPVR